MPLNEADVKRIVEEIGLQGLLNRHVTIHLFPETIYYEWDVANKEWRRLAPGTTQFDTNKFYRLDTTIWNRAKEGASMFNVDLRVVNMHSKAGGRKYMELYSDWDEENERAVNEVDRVVGKWEEIPYHQTRGVVCYLLFTQNTPAAGANVLTFGRYADIQPLGWKWFQHKLKAS